MKNQPHHPKNPTKDTDQIKAFRKAAREAGCDDNEERFQNALRTVAKAKPSVEKPKRSQQQQENKAKE
jgi:hypothetical protein